MHNNGTLNTSANPPVDVPSPQSTPDRDKASVSDAIPPHANPSNVSRIVRVLRLILLLNRRAAQRLRPHVVPLTILLSIAFVIRITPRG
ncbi:hypothetical protein ONZ45_g16099 [Pleurotus djamor]|nr:hypothetical protein ONZ45_g16099 [Pleurotus djamor]